MARLSQLAEVLGLAMLVGCAADPADSPRTGEEDTDITQKIDAPLLAAAHADARVPVLILAQEQFLSGPNAFGEFTAAHATAQRSQLRVSTLAGLKRIAARDRGALLDAALPPAAQPISLWIINAAMAMLTKPEIERAAAQPAVKYLYLLGALPPAPLRVPATTVSPAPGAFTADGKRVSWNLTQIGAPAAWEQGVLGAGVTVALIDEEVDIQHGDLVNNVWVNEHEIANNGLDDDGNGYVDDRHGFNFENMSPDNGTPATPHGTYVAGIIAGDGSGGVITGVAPRSRIMPLAGIGFAQSMLALQYALEQNADVVNMSFSLANQGNLRGPWRMAADHAVVAGLVLVSGAGNFQQSAQVPVQLRIPEDIPSVIAAGGVDASLHVAAFSSFGPVEWGTVKFFGDHPMPNGLVKPDVVAFPGAGYPVLDPAGGYIDPNNSIRGNSFSGPHVAGAAALLLSARPETPAWKINEILQATARDIGVLGKDNQTGSGLIDIPAALQRIRQ